MSKTKIVGIVILVLIAIFAMIAFDLGLFKFFAPKYENVRREVFEETKSYVHGKIQDLSKYYREYQQADSQEDRTAIESVIRSQFAEFDESNIRSDELRRFLINVRGY